MSLRVDFLEVLTVCCSVCSKVGGTLIPKDPSNCTETEMNQVEKAAEKEGWLEYNGRVICPECSDEITNIRAHFLYVEKQKGENNGSNDAEN